MENETTQVQMALFSLFSLIDEHDIYQTAMKDLIRNRHTALYAGLKMDVPKDPNGVYYYSVIDLLELSTRLHGKDFADWVQANHPGEFIFRLSGCHGVWIATVTCRVVALRLSRSLVRLMVGLVTV